MRSARTGRPAPAADAPPETVAAPGAKPRLPARRFESRKSLALASYAFACLAVLATLAACAGGSAQEARRGQQRDAAASPNLPREQATRTAQRFFPKTPTPKPTPPPPPTLGSIAMTLGLGGDGAPLGAYASVPADAGTAYVAAFLQGVAEGQVVAARFVDAFGGTVGTSNVEIESDAEASWVGLPLTLNGALPAGEYGVYVFVGERRIGSLLFRIDPPGTGGTLLADLPQNPQADRGGPNQPVPGPTGRQTPGAGGQPIQGGQVPAQPGQQPISGEYGVPTAYPGQVPVPQDPVPVVTDPGAVPPAEGTTGEWVPTQTP